MDVVHRRRDEQTGDEVVWVSDRTRPFVVVLIEHDRPGGGLSGFSHLGVGCESREEVERRCELARGEGRTVLGPHDSGPPVGYIVQSDGSGPREDVAPDDLAVSFAADQGYPWNLGPRFDAYP